MPCDSSFLVKSPFGLVSLESAAVPSVGFEPATASLGGSVARAPSGVPGVAEEEGAGLPAGADDAGAPPAGVELPWPDDGGCADCEVASELGAGAAVPWPAPGAAAGEAGADEAGADDAGAAGAVAGASARLQPATSIAPNSEAAITVARRGRGGVARGEEALARFIVFLEQVDPGAGGGAGQAADAASIPAGRKVHA